MEIWIATSSNFVQILRNLIVITINIVTLTHGLRLELQSTDDNLNLFTLLFNNPLTNNDWLLNCLISFRIIHNMSQGHFNFFFIMRYGLLLLYNLPKVIRYDDLLMCERIKIIGDELFILIIIFLTRNGCLLKLPNGHSESWL